MAGVKATDPYEILGLAVSADEVEIRRAYRRRARDLHPDKNPDNKVEAELNFHRLQTAYEFLLDPKKKADYDEALRKESASKERVKKQSAEKRKFAEELERREKEFAERNRNDVFAKSREKNQPGASPQERTGDAGVGCVKKEEQWVELRWDPKYSFTPSAEAISRPNLMKHFGNPPPAIWHFDHHEGKAFVCFESKEAALEAKLDHMRCKSSRPYNMKILTQRRGETPDPIRAEIKKRKIAGKSKSSCSEETHSASSKVENPSTADEASSSSKVSSSSPPTQLTFEEMESQILAKLKAAAEAQQRAKRGQG